MDKDTAIDHVHFALLSAYAAASMTYPDDEMVAFGLLPSIKREHLMKAQTELFSAFDLSRADFSGDDPFIFS
tara:strand:- start:403 stop:618 length:216 start_codon:yes stop_codon:yes gene_type:complete